MGPKNPPKTLPTVFPDGMMTQESDFMSCVSERALQESNAENVYIQALEALTIM